MSEQGIIRAESADEAHAARGLGSARGTRRRRTLWVGAAALALVVAAPVAWVQVTGNSRAHASVEDVPTRPVALVLGAGLRADGTPSPYLTRRLDAARELYERGTVEVILVSGDGQREGYDEPAAMADWLTWHGVPAERIVRDTAGLDTHDSCVRAREVYGVSGAVVLTQDYHLPRALFSCAQAGIDAVGLGVSAQSVRPAKALIYRVREVPASLKAAWDAVTRREPVHPGEPSTSVADALAAGA